MRRDQPGSLQQKKSLGQVFLTTDWPVTRMAEKLRDNRVDRVLEIGPGGGMLTRGLLQAGLRVLAVEKDDRFAARLGEYVASLPADKQGLLEVVNEDVLRYDWEPFVMSGGRHAIVGNIPYNISSPLVIRTLGAMRHLTCAIFMTQLEFAARLVARPDTKDYGSLSVFAQLRAELTLEFKVERGCFKPVPKVDSAVVSFWPRREVIDDLTLHQVEQVTRLAFQQRRKKMRNSIRPLLDARGGEAGCPIDLERRAETLSIREFITLAKFLLEP